MITQIYTTRKKVQEDSKKVQRKLTEIAETGRQVKLKEKHANEYIKFQVQNKLKTRNSELEKAYVSKLRKTQALLVAPTVYSLILTVILLIRLPGILNDTRNFIHDIGMFLKVPPAWIAHYFSGGWTWLVFGIVWIIMLIIMLVGIGALIWIVGLIDWKFMDLIIMTIIFATVLVVGGIIKTMVPFHVNMIWAVLIVLLSYFFVRAYIDLR
ncbi:MAG TPA: DUF6040 family protein [Enterococcus faecalis]|nr:DUF6040 family protein [Enterococcus faecalis]